MLGQATEFLGHHSGPRIGGVLNATFGNAAELIITIFALSAGLTTVVKASIIGSIIGNVLLVLGASLLLGGPRNRVHRPRRQVQLAGGRDALRRLRHRRAGVLLLPVAADRDGWAS
ncbi:MAG TPA: hypothetical protein VK902_24890, partial [Rubrobacter sp.]|nr:hypothetical protein [Rubrobacter sp.]